MNHDLLLGIQNSVIALWVAKSNHLVGAALQVVHVLGLLILLAALILTALRLQGGALADVPTNELLPPVRRLWWGGLVAVTVSGLLMFISAAVLYGSKPVFSLKLGLFALALVAQLSLHRAVRDVPQGSERRLAAAGWAALALWLLVAAAGRAIGFV